MNGQATGRKLLEGVARADLRVEQAVARTGSRPEVQKAALVSKLADQPELRMLSAACTLAGLLAGNRRLARAGVRMLLMHEVATFAKDQAKKRIDRTRPRNARSISQRKPRLGRNPSKAETSFPSGHTAGAFAVAQGFAGEFPEYRAAALAGAAILSFAQIPRRNHYASDLVAGASIGLLVAAAFDTILPAAGHQRSMRSSP